MIQTFDLSLRDKKQLNDNVCLASFSHPENTDWTFNAGQYMIFQIPPLRPGEIGTSKRQASTSSSHPIRRLYSIASPPSQKESLDFIVELVPDGVGSTHVKNMNVGDTLTMQGPAGIFTFKPSGNDIIFLATGTGIAPIYSMIADMLQSGDQHLPSNIYLFWGMKYQRDVYLYDELKKLAKEHENFHFNICLSREGNINLEYCMSGRVTKGFEDLTSNVQHPTSNFDYYLCGSKHVVESLREYLAERNIPKEQVHFEKFT